MTYTNVQIQLVAAADDPYNLAIHANKGDNTPGCGQPLRNWTDPKTGIRHNARYAVVDKPATCMKIGCLG